MMKLDRFKYIFLIASVIAIDKFLDYLLSCGVVYLGICLFMMIIIGALYLRKYTSSNMNIVTLLILTANVTLYMSTRMTVSALRTPLTEAFSLNAKSISLFASLMSIGYGLIQFGTGILLSRFGLNYAAVSVGIYGILQIVMSKITNYNIMLFLRLILGLSAGSTVIAMCTFLTSAFPTQIFGVLFNLIIFVAYKCGAIIDFLASKALNSKTILWNNLLCYLGVAGLIISGVLFIFGNRNNNTNKTDILIDDKGGLKFFFTNTRLLLLGIYSWTSVVFMYIFQNGLFNPLIASLSSNIDSTIGSFTLNSASAVYSLALPFLILMFGIRLNLLFAGICGMIGVLSLLCCPSILTVKIAAIGFGILGMSHNIPPLLIAEVYGKSKSSGVYFGMMNFFAMFFGCSFSQYGSGWLLDLIWKKQGSIMKSGLPFYDANSILTLIKYLSPFVIISFAIVILLAFQKDADAN